MFKSFSFFSVLLALVVFTSCGPEEMITPADNPPEDLSSQVPKVAPELPPAEMYTIPLSFFLGTEGDPDNSAKRLGNANFVSTHNFQYGAGNLLLWNTKVAFKTVLPLYIFAQAYDAEPVPLDLFTWQRKYQYNGLGGKTFDVVLTSKYIIEWGKEWEVEWTMTLSEEGGFQDFEWLKGIVALNFSRAEFSLNQDPSNPSPLVYINYEGSLDLVDPLQSEVTIRYTSADPNRSTFKYLEYSSIPESGYTGSYDIKGAEGSSSIEIQWNLENKTGRVKDFGEYGDNEWHCWDEALEDTDC